MPMKMDKRYALRLWLCDINKSNSIYNLYEKEAINPKNNQVKNKCKGEGI